MFNKLKRMWRGFLDGLKLAKEALRKEKKENRQEYSDIFGINWLAMCVSKLSNYACTEATFKLETRSNRAAALEGLCKDLETNRFNITNEMIGDGECYVFPSTDSRGNLYHSYISADKVRFTAYETGKIKQAYAVLDYADINNSTYYLQRVHTLDDNGTLSIKYQTVSEDGRLVKINHWAELTEKAYNYANANNIGFGRFKSPANPRNISTIYGVPLNFGCGEIERQLKQTMEQIEQEFENGKSVIFTDPRNLMSDKDSNQYKLSSNIIPIKHNSGDTAPLIDIFSPALRFSEHYEKLQSLLALYEMQIGVSKGLLTDNSATSSATATEVRRTNADTVAFLNNIHTAITDGCISTLEADSVYLNIPRESWEFSADYFDPFADPQEQWKSLLEAKEAGAAELYDVVKWQFPGLTDDEINTKIERIKAETDEKENRAIDRILAGG